MAFNLYFAGSHNEPVDNYLIELGCCRLFSQANEKKAIAKYTELDSKKRPTLLIDSGAFSVAHSGKKVDIDDYIKYINDNDNTVDWWVELDVIPFPVLNERTAQECSEKSWENYLYMLPQLKKPEKLLPLYHFGEPVDNLKRMINTPCVNGNCPIYVGIGGRHGVATEHQYRYFDKIFNIIAKSDNPNVKVHAFGVTVLPLLQSFPFYSSDSTRWLKISAYGQVMTSQGLFFVTERSVHRNKSFYGEPEAIRDKILEELHTLGYTLEDVATDNDKRAMYNAKWFKNWEENYTLTPRNKKKISLL